ncbi:MAG: hypothetical protein AAFU79_26150, partial [Myxococcota bacterium]
VDRYVLTGPEGVRAELLQTAESALVRLTNVRDTVDGAVLLSELGGSTAERYYLTEVNGREVRLLGRKDRNWRLYYGGPMQLTADEAASAALDAQPLIDEHVAQRASGRLGALARFDVSGAKSYAETKLAETMARVEDKCGFVPETSIDFEGLTEEQMKRYSLSGYCDAARGALERACTVPELKAFVAETSGRYRCRFGPEMGLEAADGQLTFTTAFDTPNQDAWAREALDGLTLPDGATVRARRIQSKTTVCSGPDGGMVVVGPSEDEATSGVSYGRKGRLVRQPERRMLSEGWFFEPRFPNPQHNNNFRGYDLRFFSYVETDGDKACTLHCGTREIALQPLSGDEKQAFLEKASFAPVPDAREAYALARDKRGIYYYVDRGATAETAKDFRLYVGKQGRLRRQKMRDIVSDSEGEIFASSRGRLKLFLGKENAEWQSRGRTRKLVRAKVQENLALIYNRLGVYLGKALHTPCDDL